MAATIRKEPAKSWRDWLVLDYIAVAICGSESSFHNYYVLVNDPVLHIGIIAISVFDRGNQQLVFRELCWGVQLLRFSVGQTPTWGQWNYMFLNVKYEKHLSKKQLKKCPLTSKILHFASCVAHAVCCSSVLSQWLWSIQFSLPITLYL